MSSVEIERIKDRIHIWFQYSPVMVAQIRDLSGRSFVKTPSPHWTAPLTIQTCRDLRAMFGSELRVGPELVAWSREQVGQEASGAALATVSLAAFATSTLAVVPTRAPALYERMCGRPYQLPAAAFLASRSASLIADSPGLGKTTEILAGLVEKFDGRAADVIVVAPKTSLETVWGPDTRAWLPDAEVFVVPDGGAARDAMIAEFNARRGAPDRKQFLVLCVNAEMLQTKTFKDEKDKVHYTPKHEGLFRWSWDAQIVDEGHKYLVTNISQTWNVKMTQTRRGLALLPLSAEGIRIASSGTPFRGKMENFWGTLNWLYPRNYTSFWAWADSYLTVTDNGYGMEIGGVRKEREPDLYRSLTQHMLRRTKPELRMLNPEWAPPDKEYVSVRCVMGAKQRKHYLQMADNAALTIDEGSLTANGVLAEMTRLKQLAHASGGFSDTGAFAPALPSAKFDQMVQMLEERGISGYKADTGAGVKVVIGSQFTQMLNLYATELGHMGIEYFIITGETPTRQRTAAVEAFQAAGGPRVFIINTQAGGVSITLDAADELWVLDETWNPDDQEQLEDRVHRTSRVDHQVTISYFFTADTIEEDIASVTQARDATQKAHLDGRRGVEWAKRWASGRSE